MENQVDVQPIGELEVKKFEEEVNENPILQKHHKRLVDNRFYGFLIAFFMIALLIFAIGVGGFIYLGYNDYFKSETLQDINVNPEIKVPVENSYDFKPTVQNQYKNEFNHTIYITNVINVEKP